MVDHYGYYHNESDKSFISQCVLKDREPNEWPKAVICTHDNCLEWGDFKWYFPERTCKNIARNIYYGFHCSECDFSQEEPNDYGNNVTFSEWEHCPKCGAKVVE